MEKNNDILHEAKRLRLLAAALELQHFTSTESNIVHIPGGDRVIAIGTPAQVRALVRAEMPPELKAAIEEAAKTRATGAVLPDGTAVFINYGHQPEDTEHLNCTACGGSGHIDDQTRAARDVLAERRRQIEAEGWTPAHDDAYKSLELNRAAACYISFGANPVPGIWPWPREWWKPTNYRRNLVKAAALVLAEIERIDRAADTDQVDSEGGNHD